MAQPMETSAASQKHVVIWSIKGNKLKDHKACFAAEYLGPIEWDNVNSYRNFNLNAGFHFVKYPDYFQHLLISSQEQELDIRLSLLYYY